MILGFNDFTLGLLSTLATIYILCRIMLWPWIFEEKFPWEEWKLTSWIFNNNVYHS